MPKSKDMQTTTATPTAHFHVALRSFHSSESSPGERDVYVPRYPGPHALGCLPAHPQFVVALDGPPKERRIRVQQSASPFRLLIEEDVPSNGLWESQPRSWAPGVGRKLPLRSRTVPVTGSQATPAVKPPITDAADGTALGNTIQHIFSYTIASLPSAVSPAAFLSQTPSPTQRTSRPSSISSSLGAFPGTPSDSAESDLGVRVVGSTELIGSPLALTKRPSTDALLDELAVLELARFACEDPHLRVSFKRGTGESVSARPSKRQRQRDLPAPHVSDETSEAAESDHDEAVLSDPGVSAGGCDTPASQEAPRTFLCPFSHKRPQGGRRCSRKATSPRMLEGHLHVFHRQAPHCPRCGSTFETHAAENEHIVSSSCKRKEVLPTVEGLTETQTRKLSRCLDQALSEEDQYRAMWAVVHPGMEPQPEPEPEPEPEHRLHRLRGEDCTEAVKALRKHWRKNGMAAIRDFFTARKPGMYIGAQKRKELQAAVLARMTEHLLRSATVDGNS